MPSKDTKQVPHDRSKVAFAQARQWLPGGVNSPVRAFKAVDRDPIFVARGRGARVEDIDGNNYIDYIGSYGPLILGHAPAAVVTAIKEAATRGTSFGMPTIAETELAQAVAKAVPSMQVVRFVNSGTEATMSAIRLARAATNHAKIIKFAGCYHGHSDGLLVEAGSGAMTLGVPSSPGVPQDVTQNTIVLPYNDLAAVEKTLAGSSDIAGIIVEPVAGNMGTVPPVEGYLQGLKALCEKHGAILIFDEVMSGFRVAFGGAQSIYNVTPDLTCLGKIVGGGLPCAAYGGREDLMRQMAPEGPVYQAGTLSGNPLAMAAGLATLAALKRPDVYEKLEQTSALLVAGLEKAAANAGVTVQSSRVGSMCCVFFTDKPVQRYEDAAKCDTKAFSRFFNVMLERGVMLPPSQFETWFVSTEHDQAAIEQTLDAAADAFKAAAGKD